MRTFTLLALICWIGLPLESPLVAADSISLLGDWEATAETPNGDTSESSFTISKEGGEFTGTAVGSDDVERPIDRINIDGKTVTFELDVEGNGQKGLLRVVAEETEKGKLSGKWHLFDDAGTEHIAEAWTAVRTSAPAEPAPAATNDSIAGKWNAIATTDDGTELESEVTFTQNAGVYSGGLKSERADITFDKVNVSEKKVTVDFVLDLNGNEVDTRIVATLENEDLLTGKWVIFDGAGQEAATGPWKAERVLTLDLAGTWNVLAKTDQGDNEHQIMFEKTGSGFQGKAESDAGSAEFTEVKVDGNEVNLALPFGEGTIKVAASYKEKNKLTGTWAYHDSDDIDQATGEWVATKEIPKVVPTVVGEWAIVIALGGNERTYDLAISEDGEKLSGVFTSDRSDREFACDSVSFEDGKFKANVTREVRGNDVQFVYEGTLSEDGSLSGTVVPKGYEDQFQGTWTGKREP